MRRPIRHLLIACVLLLPFLLGTSAVLADEWGDARKAFRKAQKSESVATRSGAFQNLLDFDGTEKATSAVDEIFKALAKEQSPAVIMAGIDTLATFLGEEAKVAIEETVRKGRGSRRLYALLALADRPQGGGEDLLLDVLQGKDDALVSQAAIALGRRRYQPAYPIVLALLERDSWQLRAAGARTLEKMAGDPTKDPKTGEEVIPPLPTWMDKKATTAALVQSLATATGRARGDIVKALERVNLLEFGGDLKAWQDLLAGKDPKDIRAKPAKVPYVCGLPMYGRKIVILIDISTCTDDTHPYQDLDRLKELLKVPGARPAALPNVRTRKGFIAAHARRLIQDLPPKGCKFEVIAVFQEIEFLFGKLTNANAGTKKSARRWIKEFTVQNGPNHYLALNAALDISGTKESVAWSLGPDEIILMTCSVPWAPADPGAVTNQTEIGAAIGLKARLRMVPIHTIGVGPHPWEMMKSISSQTGGEYLDLSK